MDGDGDAAQRIAGAHRYRQFTVDRLAFPHQSATVEILDVDAGGNGDREHPAVRCAEIDRLSADWRGFDKVRDFVVVGEELTVGNDMLTPSLKVKRRNVMARYGAELDRLYASSSSGSSSRTVSPSQ